MEEIKCYCGHTTTCDCGPETLEEAAEGLYLSYENNKLLYGHSEDLQLAYKAGIFDGAKWQQEKSYSEEDIKSAFKVGFSIGYGSDIYAIDEKNRTCEEWFKQFKNK